jgi:hypothetical protein
MLLRLYIPVIHTLAVVLSLPFHFSMPQFHLSLLNSQQLLALGLPTLPNIPLAGLLNMTSDEYFAQLGAVLNSKEFLKAANFPQKTGAETYPLWYDRLTIFGQIHGVYIPPWGSINSLHAFGTIWWPLIPAHVSSTHIGHMGVLIKQGLTITGVLLVNSNKRGIIMGSTCGYRHALHALIMPYHPSLGNNSLFSAIPKQGPNKTTQTYILRITSYTRQEHVAGHIYNDKDISRMILQNLRANIRGGVQPLLCPHLMHGADTDPCPIDLTAHHVCHTSIEATLPRLQSIFLATV